LFGIFNYYRYIDHVNYYRYIDHVDYDRFIKHSNNSFGNFNSGRSAFAPMLMLLLLFYVFYQET